METVRIFYADDDEDDRFLFETALEKINIPCQLSSFENGLLLEKGLLETNYNCDLVFLDLNMPVRNGLDTLAALQPVIKTSLLKVVIFSTTADPLMIKKTFDLNALLYVQKPEDFTELTTTLQTIIEKVDSYGLPPAYQDYKFTL